jgi:hypothetical protein
MLVPLTMIGIGLALLVVGLPMGGRAILRFRTRQATAEELARPFSVYLLALILAPALIAGGRHLARPSRGVLTLGQAASGRAR